MTTITQQIVGELITHEKHTFVDGKLIYAIVEDTIAEYEKTLTNISGKLTLKDRQALGELRDVIQTTSSHSDHSVILSLDSAQRIKRLLNHNVRS